MIDFERMRELIRQVPRQCFEIQKALSAAVGGSPGFDDMPHGTSAGDKLERDVIKLTEIRDAYAEAVEELETMRRELRPHISDLDDPNERAVMRLRYLDGYSPDQIASDCNVGMARMTVYRYLRSAEAKIMQKVGT